MTNLPRKTTFYLLVASPFIFHFPLFVSCSFLNFLPQKALAINRIGEQGWRIFGVVNPNGNKLELEMFFSALF